MAATKNDYKIKAFRTQLLFEKWLEKNCEKEQGLWLRFFKKGSGIKSITYAEALDVALCFGWIDGQVQSYDGESWLQKFTHRRPRSIWSKKNTEHIERLIQMGRMRPQGLEEVQKAKMDGRWERAYASPVNMEVPADFIEAVSKNKKAKAFFDSLNKTNRFAIAFQLATAKRPETRANRMKKLAQMMKEGKKLH